MIMLRLILATRNGHKVSEMRQILGPAFQIFSQADYPAAPGVIEDAETFAGNAAKKAEGLMAWILSNADLGVPFSVLADDSGLEVDALNGAPGVHSARFAAEDSAGGANSPDSANNAKLLRMLADVPPDKRGARFRCVLALASPGSPTRFFDGKCEGAISLAASGVGGFGYDPLFVPAGFAASFAELGEDVKNKISHRARAVAELQKFLSAAQSA